MTRPIKNSVQGGGRVDWGPRGRLQQTFHFLRGEFSLFWFSRRWWCQGKGMVFTKKDRWTSFGWEVPWTTLMCQMEQLHGESDYKSSQTDPWHPWWWTPGTSILPSSWLTMSSFLPCQWELVWFVYKLLTKWDKFDETYTAKDVLTECCMHNIGPIT